MSLPQGYQNNTGKKIAGYTITANNNISAVQSGNVLTLASTLPQTVNDTQFAISADFTTSLELKSPYTYLPTGLMATFVYTPAASNSIIQIELWTTSSATYTFAESSGPSVAIYLSDAGGTAPLFVFAQRPYAYTGYDFSTGYFLYTYNFNRSIVLPSTLTLYLCGFSGAGDPVTFISDKSPTYFGGACSTCLQVRSE